MVEGARLESVFRGNSNVGSNPTLSATSEFVRTGHIGNRTFRRHRRDVCGVDLNEVDVERPSARVWATAE